MLKLRSFLTRFAKDEKGAALVEYSILIGLITAATIATIILVGNWVSGAWTYLNTNLGAVPGAGG